MNGHSARSTPHRIAALVFIAFGLLGVYAIVRILVLISTTSYGRADVSMAMALVVAELFLAVHAVGYFASMLKAERMARHSPPDFFLPPASAPVAVAIASYNEARSVLEETICSVLAMDYPAIRVYLLDDSTDEECCRGARELAKIYGISLVHRPNRIGYKAGAINELIPRLTEPYLALLDADQRPIASWLKDVVPPLEADEKLALVQVPQVYANTNLPVARAAAYQQAIFFEYICEGKAHSNALFCCGSNVVLRVAALEAVAPTVGRRRQYFDEQSVTEDFATSVHLHAAGWKTAYVNRTYVLGMGPETLPAYFTQQMRWAMGTLGVGLRLMRMLLRRPRTLGPAQAWEYLLSGTYYFVGFANLVFLTAPVAGIAFGIKPVQGHTGVYLLTFIPYLAFTMNLVFYGMQLRGYPMRGIWVASALSFATSWTYVRAGIVALFGLRRAFGVTPKGVGGAIPLRHLLPELSFFMATSCAATAGLVHIAMEGPDLAYVVNTFWSSYHALVLSVLFVHLNRPINVEEREPVFALAA